MAQALAPTYKWVKNEKEPEPPVVRVTWRDAVAAASWTPVSEAGKMIPDTIETIGFLIEWSETGITVAGSFSESSNKEQPEVTCFISIPNVWINSVKHLQFDNG